jgi:chromosome segregation ATPase
MSVQAEVNALIEEVALKDSIILAKIRLSEDQATAKHAEIISMTRRQIDLELADDTKAHSELAQKISLARENHTDLLGRIAAYRETLGDKSFLRTGVANIFEIAQSAKEQRWAEVKARLEEVEQIDKQILELRERRDKLSLESRYVHARDNVEEQTITSLFKYVENRPISFGDELAYLRAFAGGSSREELEQRFVVGIKQEKPWILPQQTFSVQPEPIRQPVNRVQGKTTTFSPYGSPDFIAQARKGSI